VSQRCEFDLTSGRHWRFYARPRWQRRSLHVIGEIHQYDDVTLVRDSTGIWPFDPVRNLMPACAVREPVLAVIFDADACADQRIDDRGL
jgi:hypothetical protein